MLTPQLLSILVIFLLTLMAGYLPFHYRQHTSEAKTFPIAEALASGIFLGAGLIHLLSDASTTLMQHHVTFPYPFILAGAMFLLLLWLEHVGKEYYHHHGDDHPFFAGLATLMLSIHAFLAGTALGFSSTLSFFLILLLAILAHKWAASFALSVYINKSRLSLRARISLFLMFALMTPLGILFGHTITNVITVAFWVPPMVTALAAGTFLYLGTLHGLSRAVLVKECCNLKTYSFVVIGFFLMALLSL